MKTLKTFYLLFLLEGLITIIWALFIPPDSPNFIFQSFSRTRIILLASLLIFWLIASTILAYTWRQKKYWELFWMWLNRECVENNRLASFIILLFSFPALLLIVTLSINSTTQYETWAPVTFPVLYAFAHRFLPLWLWISITVIEMAGLLVFSFWEKLFLLETWDPRNLWGLLIGLFITIVTIFHWAILAFQLRFFVNNPAWYWSINPLPFTIRDFWFILGILTLLGCLYWTWCHKNNNIMILTILFILGLTLQLGIGYISGNGLESLRERYFSTYHQAYPYFASQNTDNVLEIINNYENLYGYRSLTGTKPPGLLTFYIGIEKLINGWNPEYDKTQRYDRLAWAITYGFPVIALLMIFLLYSFTSRLFGLKSGVVPVLCGLLYIFSPNIVLFSLFPDQTIYPLLFLSGIILTIFVIKSQSFLWAFLLGILLYLAIFFAFTMLPLYVFTVIFFILNFWSKGKDRNWKKELKVISGITVGTVLIFLFFVYVLNYNFFPRFLQTIEINHNFDFYLRVGQKPPITIEPIATRLQQIISAAWLNNLDFAAAIGFPVYILFIVQAFRITFLVFQRKSSQAELVLTALLGSFVVLNLAGTAQGEVPRLWIFWLPLFVILASLELKDILKNKVHAGSIILALVQLITILLTYHYQDLIM